MGEGVRWWGRGSGGGGGGQVVGEGGSGGTHEYQSLLYPCLLGPFPT